MVVNLPLIRAHERIDFKRCQMMWYWNWRMGLEPKHTHYGPLQLGTWMHDTLEAHYMHESPMQKAFLIISGKAILDTSLTAEQREKAVELQTLGLAMAGAYDKYYANERIVPITAEIPLEFEISEGNKVVAIHRLKPDMVFRDEHGFVWLMEHKTAASIMTAHLTLDDQARPYGAMAEYALRKLGILTKDDVFKGVMYNFLRKAVPDTREQNDKGLYLNKDGTVSKNQPPPYFVRYPVVMTRQAKILALRRIQRETIKITRLAEALRSGRVSRDVLDKTPAKSCARFCKYFNMCTAEEQGGDITEMQKNLFYRRNPYEYAEDSADEIKTFEMG